MDSSGIQSSTSLPVSNMRKPAKDCGPKPGKGCGAMAFQSEPGTPINPPVSTMSELTQVGWRSAYSSARDAPCEKPTITRRSGVRRPSSAGFHNRFVAALDRFGEIGFVGLARIEKSAGIPTARSLGLGNDPSNSFDVAEARG